MNKRIFFLNLNTIFNLPECNSEYDSNVNFYVKIYQIIDIPPILSINTNISDYKLLPDNKNFIINIFKNKFI